MHIYMYSLVKGNHKLTALKLITGSDISFKLFVNTDVKSIQAEIDFLINTINSLDLTISITVYTQSMYLNASNNNFKNADKPKLKNLIPIICKKYNNEVSIHKKDLSNYISDYHKDILLKLYDYKSIHEPKNVANLYLRVSEDKDLGVYLYISILEKEDDFEKIIGVGTFKSKRECELTLILNMIKRLDKQMFVNIYSSSKPTYNLHIKNKKYRQLDYIKNVIADKKHIINEINHNKKQKELCLLLSIEKKKYLLNKKKAVI